MHRAHIEGMQKHRADRMGISGQQNGRTRQRHGARKYEEDEVRLKHPAHPLLVALLAHCDEAKGIAGNVLQRAEQAGDKCAARAQKVFFADLTASAPSV